MHASIRKFSLALFTLLFSFSALALTLQEAKDQGKVGEMRSGYLGVVVSSPEVEALAKDVNVKRKQYYGDIAKRNGLKLDQVAARAGVRNIERTESGHYVQNASGQWVKK